MYSHKGKFFFVHIVKTGGQSIKKDLEKHFTDVVYLPHLSTQAHFDLFPDIYSEYFSFAFVRNPWDWVVSMYFYRQKRFAEGWRRPSITQHTDFLGMEFDDFVRMLHAFEMPVNILSPILLPNGEIGVDFLGRFENLYDDLDIVYAKIGLPPIDRAKFPFINTTKHKHYSTYYTSETRQLVAEISMPVIERFGYTFEGEC